MATKEDDFDANSNGIKSFFKKFWHLLWKDDSFTGWLFSIIFLFLFIKFIFFPVLGLITGTPLPLAIVESCSMYHKDNMLSDFDSWFERHGQKYEEFAINKTSFQDFPFKNGLNKGDILFIVGVKPEKLKEGDIIIFNAAQRNPIIHRIVDIKESNDTITFSTIGDNNWQQIPFEREIEKEQIMGKAVSKIAPYAGWIKLAFFERQRTESEKGFCNEN